MHGWKDSDGTGNADVREGLPALPPIGGGKREWQEGKLTRLKTLEAESWQSWAQVKRLNLWVGLDEELERR